MSAVQTNLVPGYKYSILLPTYNEALNIEQLVSQIWCELQKIGVSFEVIVVDDSSPDNTRGVVESLIKTYGRQLVLLVREAKLGLGTAYLHGLKHATGNFIILMDADLSHPASDVTGSYRLYRRECLEALVPAITSKGYAFQMEVIVRAKRAGFTITEVPIVFVDRLHGQSKMGLDEIVLYAKTLLSLFLRL